MKPVFRSTFSGFNRQESVGISIPDFLAAFEPGGQHCIYNNNKAATMIEAFMIEYEFAGEKHFANVVTYKGSPSVFYVTPVNAIDDMPGARIILHLENDNFLLAGQSAFAGEGLIKTIGEKIAAHLMLKRNLNSPPSPSLYSS